MRDSSTITLDWRTRPGGGGRTERSFLDFIIDGQSLWERIDTDHISPLGWLPSEINDREVQRLIRKSPADFPDDRRSIYICPECAELGCGAISIVIERVDDQIIWRDLGMQNSCDPEVRFEGFEAVGPFAFAASQYRDAINSARSK